MVQTSDSLTVGNNCVQARFYLKDGGYVQEFWATDSKLKHRLLLSSIHKNLIPSSEHRSTASPMIAGDRPHLFGVCRESLRMVYNKIEVSGHDETAASVTLSGAAQGHSLTCRVTIQPASQSVHVDIVDDIERRGKAPLVEYLMSSYAFVPDGAVLSVGEKPSYTWAPNLRPGDDHLIGDAAFHSPAVIVQKGSLAAALVPDLDVLAVSRPMPVAIDLDVDNGLLPAPLLSYGFCAFERDHTGCFFAHDITMARRLSSNTLHYAFDLILDADSRRTSALPRRVSQFLWQRYGSEALRTHRHYSQSPAQVADAGAQPLHTPAEKGRWRSADNHTLASPQDGWELLRAARACLDEHRQTGGKHKLEPGLVALDQLCLMQAVWNRPWVENRQQFGLCVADNAGCRFDAELTAEFALTALDYGAATGDMVYSERGAAAFAAALAFPASMSARSRIVGVEQRIRSSYGTAYVHLGRKWAVSLDGTRIRDITIEPGHVALELVQLGPSDGRVIFGGMRASAYSVTINGNTKSHSRSELEAGLPIRGNVASPGASEQLTLLPA